MLPFMKVAKLKHELSIASKRRRSLRVSCSRVSPLRSSSRSPSAEEDEHEGKDESSARWTTTDASSVSCGSPIVFEGLLTSNSTST